MNEVYNEQREAPKDELASFKKEINEHKKSIEKQLNTVDNISKRWYSILDKATKIKPDKYKKPGMPESTDAYAGYTRKRGNITYEVQKDYSNTLIIKEAGKKDRSVIFGEDETGNQERYIIVNDELGKRYEDEKALNLAKQYVIQFKNALKIK